MEIIDAWAQPATQQFMERVPEARPLLERSGTANFKDDITPAQLVEDMDASGVTQMMLCAWHRPGSWVMSNDEVAAYIKDYPDRFTGVASVNLKDPMAAVDELERAVNELGFKALRIVPWLWELPPNHKLYYPLFVKCIQLDIPFCTQIGHTGPLMPSETGRLVPYLDEVMLTFPDLKVVGGHIGFPWTGETIGMMLKHKNFYIDTSAWLPRMYPPEIINYMKTTGRTRVMFGTNYPQLPLKRCVEQAKKLGLHDKTLKAFFGGNAKRVFKL